MVVLVNGVVGRWLPVRDNTTVEAERHQYIDQIKAFRVPVPIWSAPSP
jgi:hypothetical protein